MFNTSIVERYLFKIFTPRNQTGPGSRRRADQTQTEQSKGLKLRAKSGEDQGAYGEDRGAKGEDEDKRRVAKIKAHTAFHSISYNLVSLIFVVKYF